MEDNEKRSYIKEKLEELGYRSENITVVEEGKEVESLVKGDWEIDLYPLTIKIWHKHRLLLDVYFRHMTEISFSSMFDTDRIHIDMGISWFNIF